MRTGTAVIPFDLDNAPYAKVLAEQFSVVTPGNPNDFWVSNLGPDIIPQAFRWAHQADSHALLFCNDYNIAGDLALGASGAPRRQAR